VTSRDPESLLADLDPAQREAVTITSGPLCILAGAGTGKTRVISRRVAYALVTGVVRPRDVLVVTFTDKAATEMRGRLAALASRVSRPRRSMPQRSGSFGISGHASTATSRPASSNQRSRSLPRWRRACRAAIATSPSAIWPQRSSGPRRGGSVRASTSPRRQPSAATGHCRPI
jgi:hypothetical protein